MWCASYYSSFFSREWLMRGNGREKDLNKKWIADVDKLRTIINAAISTISDCGPESTQLRDKLKAIQITATEMEIRKALGKFNVS